MEKNIDELIEEIRKHASAAENPKRFEHSVRVAETAAYMCSLYGLDEKKGYLAGIAHDICKNIPEQEMIKLAEKDGGKFSDVEKLKPSLLHGRAAAVLLKEKFNIRDEDVIQAVAVHTLGGIDICNLAKVIYSADKIEPGREQSTDEYRARLFAMSLNELTLFVVEENMEYLKSKGKKIAPSSIEFQENLRSQIK